MRNRKYKAVLVFWVWDALDARFRQRLTGHCGDGGYCTRFFHVFFYFFLFFLFYYILMFVQFYFKN